LDKGAHRRPFGPKRPQNVSRPSGPRQGGARHGNPRQAAANARSRYQNYMSMARDAASRGDSIRSTTRHVPPARITQVLHPIIQIRNVLFQVGASNPAPWPPVLARCGCDDLSCHACRSVHYKRRTFGLVRWRSSVIRVRGFCRHSLPVAAARAV